MLQWVTARGQTLQIVVTTILIFVLYGITHDQFTARICIEYFTVGHPRYLDTNDPTIIAFFWGIVATWWFGLIMSVPIALACEWGNAPKMKTIQLIQPAAIVFLFTGLAAVVGGFIGNVAASQGWVWLLPPYDELIAPEKHVRYLTNVWAHNVAYGVGFLLVLCMCGWIYLTRQSWKKRDNTQ